MNEAPLLNLHLDEGLLDDSGSGERTTSFADDSHIDIDTNCVGTNCPVAGAKCQMREALLFNGGGFGALGKLFVAANDAYSVDEFSVGLWVNPTEFTTGPLIFGRANCCASTPHTFALQTDSSVEGEENKIVFELAQDSSRTPIEVLSAGPFADFKNQWTHLMVTYDGSTAVLYVNGSEKVSANATLPSACANDRHGMMVARGFGEGYVPVARLKKHAAIRSPFFGSQAFSILTATPCGDSTRHIGKRCEAC